MRHIIIVALILFAVLPAAAQTPPPSEGWVVLPVADYRALHDKAFPPPPPTEPPPVPATISRVEYQLDVNGDAAVGQARLTVDVFKDGWVRVPMPAGLRVRDARIDGKPITLVENADGRGTGSSVLLSKPGRAVITLDLAVPIATKSGVESIALPPSPSPVQRVSLTLRSPDLSLAVGGGFVAERTAVEQAMRFLVCGRQNEALALSWSRRRDKPSATQSLRVRGDVTEVIGLAEDSAQMSARVGIDVVQGVAERVTLMLPPSLVISQVSGALVGDWEVRGSNLVVSFLEPVERSASVTVSGEARIARDGKVPVPLMRVGSAERETGGVAVEVLGAGEIKDVASRGLDPADASDLGPMVAGRLSPALVAFRSRPQAFDAPRSLEVTVARYTPQEVLLANIEEARYTTLLTEDGKTLVEAAYAVRNSQRSFLAVTLPQGATLWSVSIDGRPVKPGRTAEGALLLPILKERASSGSASAVRVFFLDRGQRWTPEGIVAVHLPAVDLPVSRTGLQAYYSPRYRLTLEPGPFRIEEFLPPQSAGLRTGGASFSAGGGGGGGGKPTFRSSVTVGASEDKDKLAAEQGLRDLVNEYQRATRAGAIEGLLPVAVAVPALGRSIFVAAELTAEGKVPELRFTFKREVK